MSSVLGVGVIGLGLIGQKRIAAAGNSFSVIAVHDIDERVATTIGEENLGVDVSPNLVGLLDRDDIDLVVVATTHDQLAPVAMQAVERGKHVLIEKPGGVSSAELRRISDAAVANGRLVHIGFNHRFHPSLIKSHQLIRVGEYGDLLWVRGRYGHGGRPGYEKEWRADRSKSGGGELVDQGSHLIDLVRFLVGEVELAFADTPTLYWPMEVEDNAFIALRPANGGLAWLHASWTEWKNLFSLEVCFENAKIEVNGLGGSYGVERLTLYEMLPEMGPPLTSSWEWPFPDGSWRAEMEDFAAAIRGEATVGATIGDAIRVLEIIEEAYSR
jgi:predicted dehydrogenase